MLAMHSLTVILILSIVIMVSSEFNCGQTPTPPYLNEIVGGTVAKPHTWPWQIQMCVNGWFECSQSCGGSVVGRSWVLTAAHCIADVLDRPSIYRIMTGIHNINNKREGKLHKIKAIHMHPKYNPVFHSSDAALLELTDKITYNDHVQPICLPSNDSFFIEPPNTAWTTGWGTTRPKGSISTVLKQVQIPFVSYEECKNDYPGKIFEDVEVCAGIVGKDSCQGDSGGPLVVKSNSSAWFQCGITSWGYGCAEDRHPGVYSRVSAFCDWIESVTNGDVNCHDPNDF